MVRPAPIPGKEALRESCFRVGHGPPEALQAALPLNEWRFSIRRSAK